MGGKEPGDHWPTLTGSARDSWLETPLAHSHTSEQGPISRWQSISLPPASAIRVWPPLTSHHDPPVSMPNVLCTYQTLLTLQVAEESPNPGLGGQGQIKSYGVLDSCESSLVSQWCGNQNIPLGQ